MKFEIGFDKHAARRAKTPERCFMRVVPADCSKHNLAFKCATTAWGHKCNLDNRMIPNGVKTRFIPRKFFWVGRG